MQNKLSKNCQRLLKFCQSGEILPNLVTLIISQCHKQIIGSYAEIIHSHWLEIVV